MPKPNFKKGDLVICKEEGHCTPTIRIGEIYKVEKIIKSPYYDNLYLVKLKGIGKPFCTFRFEKMKGNINCPSIIIKEEVENVRWKKI